MSITFAIAALGLLVGTLMGVAMLLRPRGSHLSIGLGSVPEKSGGVGESRAFGGLLFGLHLPGLMLVVIGSYVEAHRQSGFVGTIGPDTPTSSDLIVATGPAFGGIYCAVLCIAWFCALLARIASVLIDREGVPLNLRLIGVDLFMTLTLAAPLFVYVF